MELKLLVSAVLLLCLFMVSVPFEQRYSTYMASLAHEPAARMVAALGLLWAASVDVTLGALALVILFLWMADIQLLSSLRLWKREYA